MPPFQFGLSFIARSRKISLVLKVSIIYESLMTQQKPMDFIILKQAIGNRQIKTTNYKLNSPFIKIFNPVCFCKFNVHNFLFQTYRYEIF